MTPGTGRLRSLLSRIESFREDVSLGVSVIRRLLGDFNYFLEKSEIQDMIFPGRTHEILIVE